MNKIKKVCLCFILLFLIIFSECRKGPEDPIISFRSRTARLANKWKLKTGKYDLTVNDNGTLVSELWQIDGNNATIYDTPLSTQVLTIHKSSYYLSLDISKNGTYNLEERIQSSYLSASGKWNFTSNVGDNKNKDGVLFNIDNVNNSATNSHLFNRFRTEYSYKLIELSSKEIKLRADNKTYIDGNGSAYQYSAELILIPQ